MDLAQTIDELGEAQARQTRYWLELLGLEEEIAEARQAYLRLQTDLTSQYKQVAAEWRQAKADAQAAAFFLDRAVTT
jgi:CII-binding regulator of phage lambda lysogenization HflD